MAETVETILMNIVFMFKFLKVVNRISQTFLILFSCVSLVYGQNVKPVEHTIPGTAIKFKMVSIPAGTLTLGSASTQKGHETDEGP